MGGRRAASVSGRSARSGSGRESAARRGPGSIARSGLTLATMPSPFEANQAAQLDRTEANIMMTAVMASSASDARLRRMAEARIISAALAEEHDLVGLRMQRRELEDEEKRLRAMLDVERTRVRHARAVAAAASVALGYTPVDASGPYHQPPLYAANTGSGSDSGGFEFGGAPMRGAGSSLAAGDRSLGGQALASSAPSPGLGPATVPPPAAASHWWHQQPHVS